MESVKKYFKRSNSDDDPGSIESIEKARTKANKIKKKKERPPVLKDIPKLTKELLLQSSSGSSASYSQSDIVNERIAINAAKKLYELCDVGHKTNREPMVSSGKYDLIGPLTQCLLHESYSNTVNVNNSNSTSSASSSSFNLSTSTPSQSQSQPRSSEEMQQEQQQPKIIIDDDDNAKDGMNTISVEGNASVSLDTTTDATLKTTKTKIENDNDKNTDDDDSNENSNSNSSNSNCSNGNNNGNKLYDIIINDNNNNDEKKTDAFNNTKKSTDDDNNHADADADATTQTTTPTINKIDDDDENNSNSNNRNNNNNNNNLTTTTATATAITKTKKPTIKIKKAIVIENEKLHFVCLILNNLSIPHDNKRVMVKERGAKKLIGNLCHVIASGNKDAYLCCIILMNLSFYEPGLVIIGQFSPSSPIQSASTMSTSTASAPTIAASTHSNSSSHAAKKAVTAIATTAVSTAVSTAVTTKNIVAKAVVGIKGGGQRKLTPLENPHSLLRILQELISSVEHGTSDFRWAFGLLAQLSKHPENALLIGLTGIPRVAIQNLRLSLSQQSQPSMWNTNSLEDFSLYFLLHLSEICPSNTLNGALDVIIPIMNDCIDGNDGNNKNDTTNNHNVNHSSNSNSSSNSNNGIQSLKATMICAFLGLEWEKFPDHGIIAAGTVSELMANTFERVGKKQVYTDNDFSLRTAVSAYAALAKAASKADSLMNNSTMKATTTTATTNVDNEATTTNATANADEATNNGLILPATTTTTTTITSPSQLSCSNTKVMALPTSVALLFQIINAIALNWGDEENDKNKDYETYHWDIKAGDLAVGAVMSLLPALLEGEKQKYQQNQSSQGTQQACADLSKVFVFFSKKTNSISAKARSMEIAEKLTESSASGRSLPLLECAYDLCRTSSTHRIQKNFL